MYLLDQAIRDGPVKISAQISDQVDECPSNGYLLDSELEAGFFFARVTFDLHHLQLCLPVASSKTLC